MTSTFLERVDVTGFVLTVAVAIAWGVAGSWSGAASVAVGGAMASLNLILVRQVLGGVVRRMASGDSQPPALLILYVLKFGALCLLIFLLVAVVRVDAVPLAAGMSIVPVAILIEFVRWTISAPPIEPTDSGA